jgi:transcriptional regulator with XRE-family HTH domain
MGNSDAQEDCAVLPTRQPLSKVTPEHFVPLIGAIMERDRVRQCELSRLTGLTESKISRILSSTCKMDSVSLHIIFDALKIDLLRALLAVGRLGDWQQYFDPDIEIIADLIDVLPAALTKARSGNSRVKISLPGTLVLADRLSEMIATNDRETAIRRRERPIAGM